MSTLNIIWLIVVILFAIYMIRSEKGDWKTVYEAPLDKTEKAQQRYDYLKEQGIDCRLKNFSPGTLSMMGRGSAQSRAMTSVRLQVHKKEADKANQHLSHFNY